VAVLLILAAVTVFAVYAASRLGVPAEVVIPAAVIVMFFLLFRSARLQQRLAILKIREGTDSVDFPLERLKNQLTGDDQHKRESDLEAAAESCDSWVCPHCGEPTPDDCPACVHCGRSQYPR
jgi:hypothetical protein